MSYILDALRKSEHERQIAAGQMASMLYPVEIEIKRNHKPWLILTLLMLAALVAFALIWRIWPQPIAANATDTINNRALTAASGPQNTSEGTLPNHISKPEKFVSEHVQQEIPLPTHTGARQKPATQSEIMPDTKTVISKAGHADPLKELPVLNIAGYIHNEQSGSLAMINNQLVKEGEEISPGLRLVKILEDGAIFNYQGYEFRR